MYLVCGCQGGKVTHCYSYTDFSGAIRAYSRFIDDGYDSVSLYTVETCDINRIMHCVKTEDDYQLFFIGLAMCVHLVRT